jgi:hypothetical protein
MMAGSMPAASDTFEIVGFVTALRLRYRETYDELRIGIDLRDFVLYRQA